VSRVLLDARHVFCPLPVIRVQDCVAQLPPGTLVEAVCTDRGALNDIPAWCRLNGHKVVETKSEDFEFTVILEVGGL
jgi:tRNA 2-thiouridine synthesizing protein A